MHKNPSAIRCAIYTRKSTEEGLDQDFNSLDAQREAAEAFIGSQKGAGWKRLPARYDDGGFSGGNLDRPALRRLLEDIEARRVDCVVVYKVDRLSRSLLDFARLIDRFDQRAVSFVSVTQQFNTTSSLGRLTLNILLSFAEFEHQIISERTRDKMSAARRKGKWVGATNARCLKARNRVLNNSRQFLRPNPSPSDLTDSPPLRHGCLFSEQSMSLETKFLRLRQAVPLGGRIDGWRVRSIRESRYESLAHEGGAQAWLMRAVRTP